MSSSANYIECKTEVVRVDERDGHRLVIYHAPLRYKHSKWIVAVERKNDFAKSWVRKTDQHFDSESDAVAYFKHLVSVAARP